MKVRLVISGIAFCSALAGLVFAHARWMARAPQDPRFVRFMRRNNLRANANEVIPERGKALDLTPGEFDLLVRLVAHRGRVFARPPDERTVDVQVAKLRQKLGRWGDHIETIRGVGYRIKI